MPGVQLKDSVDRFIRLLINRPDSDLERPWAWGEYDSEGIRFAFFRTYQELRDLAVRLIYERDASQHPLTSAQRILASYLAAFRDLQGLAVGITAEEMNQAPDEKEWPIRRVVAHSMITDVNFYVVVRYALDGYRTKDGRPPVTPDDQWNAIVGMADEPLQAIIDGPADGILAYHAGLCQRVLDEFAGITEEELGAPSRFWESYDLDLRFRLHRFESHLRQHTIQVEKTLAAIGVPRTEIGQLARMLYRGLADAEGSLIGAWQISEALVNQVSERIISRVDEIGNSLKLA